MNERVVITGLGVVSSIGIGWQEFWENLLAGKSGISPVTSFDTANQFTHNGGEVKQFKPEEFITQAHQVDLSRASQMALAAAKLAVRDAKIDPTDLLNIPAGVCVGTNIGSIQTVEIIDEIMVREKTYAIDSHLLSQIATNTTAAVIGREFRLRGPSMMFSTACAAGNYAIGYGYDLIKLRKVDLVLAGGSDAFSKVAFTGFNQFKAVAPEKCQPFDKNRKGMMVAEAAGSLVLESMERALDRKATIYGEIIGYGLSCDAYHMTASSVQGVAESMNKAFREAGCTPEDVDFVSAHGTGTPTNDRNECAAMKQVFGDRYRTIPTSSIKSMIGHTMGAASALEAIVCALVVKTNMIPPTLNFETPDPECDIDCVPNRARNQTVDIALNNSYAFGGNNASLVIKKFTEREELPSVGQH
jgi:3-oxoacyl-[acyl-carrier-protein] synthase II